jgi:hypothetical protein
MICDLLTDVSVRGPQTLLNSQSRRLCFENRRIIKCLADGEDVHIVVCDTSILFYPTVTVPSGTYLLL